MTENTVIDMETVVSATDEDLDTVVPAIEGLSRRQVRAICRIAATQDVVISNSEDIVVWAQGLLDRDVTEGKREHSFSLKSVGAAGKHVLNRMSQERAQRAEDLKARQATEDMSDRQTNRLNQLVKWANSLDLESGSFEDEARNGVLEVVKPVLLSLSPSKLEASKAISLFERFGALTGLEVPTSVNATRSAEGEAVATIEDSSDSGEESAF